MENIMKYELFLDVDEPRYDDPDSPNKIDLGVFKYGDNRYDLGAYHCDSEPEKAYLWIRNGEDIEGMSYKRAIDYIQDSPPIEEGVAMGLCVKRFMECLLRDIKHHTDQIKQLDQ